MTSCLGVSVFINYQTDEGAAMQVQHPFQRSASAALLLSVTRQVTLGPAHLSLLRGQQCPPLVGMLCRGTTSVTAVSHDKLLFTLVQASRFGYAMYS